LSIDHYIFGPNEARKNDQGKDEQGQFVMALAETALNWGEYNDQTESLADDVCYH
jgi:hypothetical protein